MAPVPVGREERRALLFAAAGYFCLLCGYYMLRPLRDSLALEVGVRHNRWLFTAVLVCSVGLAEAQEQTCAGDNQCQQERDDQNPIPRVHQNRK